MSTIWTPRGEHQVPRPGAGEASEAPSPLSSATSPPDLTGGDVTGPRGQTEAQERQHAQAELDALRAQLLEAPVDVVIANHAMGLWELAALHLSARPAHLPQAQLAIDALAALVEGLPGRLGDAEKTLQDGLAQIRMAYVQVHRAQQDDVTGPS